MMQKSAVACKMHLNNCFWVKRPDVFCVAPTFDTEVQVDQNEEALTSSDLFSIGKDHFLLMCLTQCVYLQEVHAVTETGHDTTSQ